MTVGRGRRGGLQPPPATLRARYQAPAVYAAARTTHDRLSLTAAPMSRASVGVLRAAVRPVDLNRYALRVGSRVDQVERDVRAGVGEQPRALAEDHGDDEQVHLV